MKQIWVIAQNTVKAMLRKKDFYVFLIMLLALLVFLVSQSFFGVRDISGYVKDIGFSCIWIFSLIIAVTFSAKQIPEEIERKTALPLLAKPVGRNHFLIGRFLGSVSASSFAYSVFYLVYIYAVFLKGGTAAFPVLFQSYILGVCFLSIVSAVSILLSVTLTFSAAVTMSFIIYFAVTWFADGMRKSAGSLEGLSSAVLYFIYYLIPHYEFYDMRIRLVHPWGPLPLWAFSAVIMYTLIYIVLILYISNIILRKKVY